MPKMTKTKDVSRFMVKDRAALDSTELVAGHGPTIGAGTEADPALRKFLLRSDWTRAVRGGAHN